METMNRNQVLVSIVIAVIGSGIINVFFNQLFSRRNMKKEQKMRAEDATGKKISDALLEVKELIRISEGIEIYNVSEEIERNDFNAFKPEAIYPEIMDDVESLFGFLDLIRDCRKRNEPYLDCGTALHLVFIERYMEQMIHYIGTFNEPGLIPVFGTIFIVDIQQWQRRCDKQIIKRIKHQKYELEYQKGLKWKVLRKKIIVGEWEKTILYTLINDKPLLRKHKSFNSVKELVEEISSNPKEFIPYEVSEQNDKAEIIIEFNKICEEKGINNEEQVILWMKKFIQNEK